MFRIFFTPSQLSSSSAEGAVPAAEGASQLLGGWGVQEQSADKINKSWDPLLISNHPHITSHFGLAFAEETRSLVFVNRWTAFCSSATSPAAVWEIATSNWNIYRRTIKRVTIIWCSASALAFSWCLYCIHSQRRAEHTINRDDR